MIKIESAQELEDYETLQGGDNVNEKLQKDLKARTLNGASAQTEDGEDEQMESHK